MSKGKSIGVIVVSRRNAGPFSAHHVRLLQTFADQAVIAIENVRLFGEVQARTLAAIAERSNRLVDGLSTAVYSLVGDTAHLMAFTPVSPTADAALQEMFPAPLSQLAWNESILDGKTFVITDAEVDFVASGDE